MREGEGEREREGEREPLHTVPAIAGPSSLLMAPSPHWQLAPAQIPSNEHSSQWEKITHVYTSIIRTSPHHFIQWSVYNSGRVLPARGTSAVPERDRFP